MNLYLLQVEELQMIASILYSLAVLLGIFALYNYLGYRSQKRAWKQKMEEKHGSSEKRQSFIVVLGDRFDKTKWAAPMKQKLQSANLPLAPSEFYAMLIVGGMAISILSNTLFDIKYPINLVLGIVAAVASYWLIFIIRKNKYNERLNNQLAEVCRLLGNSARAGLTISQGIELVSREVSSPAREEFQRITNELKLGVNFDRVLRDLQKRVPSREFQLFAATLLIQKQSGGDLHAVLDEMATTLEERKTLQQTIKTMTAEERYTSILVPALPVVLILMMNQIMDGFLDPITTIPGMILGGIFLIGTVVTFLLIRKVTNIKV